MSRSSRIYIKPLTKRVDFKGTEPEKVLKSLDREILRRLQSRLLQTTFSKRAKIALAKAIRVKREANSIIVTANHPAFFPLVKGQKKQQMRWLTKSKRPIPIITEEGKLIFRWATARSMKQKNAKGDPKWTHPGRRAQNIIERAKKDTLEFLTKRVSQELKRQVKIKVKGR